MVLEDPLSDLVLVQIAVNDFDFSGQGSHA